MLNIEGYWDIVISSLQDICNANESTTFDDLYLKYLDGGLPTDLKELNALKSSVSDHKSNIQTSARVIETCQQNLTTLIANLQKQGRASRNNSISKESKTVSGKKQKKVGRLYYTSKYNSLEPVVLGSEVAYKLKNRHGEEWIQCEVTKILGDGMKFEIRDPEPDENNNPGQTFKANYKEIILISPPGQSFPNYPYGFKVLARYPETTTFYPAVVVGTKKDGTVRLKFDGEEEANKETEVDRRSVLPFPDK